FYFAIGSSSFACFSSIENKVLTRVRKTLINLFLSGSADRKPVFCFSSFLICCCNSSNSFSAVLNSKRCFWPLISGFRFFNWRTSFASLEIPGLRRINACTPQPSQMKYRLPFLSFLISRSSRQRKQGICAILFDHL